MDATQTPTPTAPAAGARTFRRLGSATSATTPGAAAAATAAATAVAPSSVAAAEDSGAQAEGANPADMLVLVDFGEALAHNSDGTHRGTIKQAKPTKEGNGFYVQVIHEDGSTASALFMLFNVVKENGRPKLGPDGKPEMTKNIRGQKAWAEFCKGLDIAPQDLARSIVDFAAQRTGERPPIVGLELVWDFVTKGDFCNATLNVDATAVLIAEQQAAAV